MRQRSAWWLLLALLGCRTAPSAEPAPGAFRTALQQLCDQAFEGRLVEGREPSDSAIGEQRLVTHVRSCSADEVRIPFHVGENRSRTF